MGNIDFTEFKSVVDAKTDLSNKNPTLWDIDKLLWWKKLKSQQVLSDKETYYKNDIQDKYNAWKCKAIFENFEWRDLTMCVAYVEQWVLSGLESLALEGSNKAKGLLGKINDFLDTFEKA